MIRLKSYRSEISNKVSTTGDFKRVFFEKEISQMACHLPEDSVMFLFTWISILLFSPVSVGETGSLQCPSLVQVELGTNGVIACNISFEFKNLYWYEGESFSDYPPIIRFQDGVPEKGDEFEITPDGALIILNADISREGIYTVVVFRLNTQHESASVLLKTFAHPTPPFPVIKFCNGTQNCHLKKETNGSVQCSLYGARPAFELTLKSSGITLTNIIHSNSTDSTTGLADTFVKANYHSTECLQLSNITCMATGSETQKIMSTATLHDDCTQEIPENATGKGSGGVAVAITLVIVVIIVAAVVATICFKRFSATRKRAKNGKHGVEYEQINQADPVERGYDKGNKDNTNQVEVKQNIKTEKKQKENVEDEKTKLLDALSEKYRADYFGSVSSDRIISIDDVYIDLEFVFTNDSGETKIEEINQLLMQPYINDKKNRIFVSNKIQLTFSSYFAYLWSEKETKDNILLHFNMQMLSYDTNIVTAIKEMLQNKLPISEDLLIKVLETFGCHIILEEVELEHVVEKPSEHVTDEQGDLFSKWTIDNILRVRERKSAQKKIFQWVIVYNRDNFGSAPEMPYELVYIKEITNLFFDHFDKYIDKVVAYYNRDKEETSLKTVVKEFITQSELQKKFEKSPALLFQMTHVVTKMFLNNRDASKSARISTVITESLALLKTRYLRKFCVSDGDILTSLEEKLGEVAFNQINNKGNANVLLSEDMMKFCKSVGLIMQSSLSDQIIFTNEQVKFFMAASSLKEEKSLQRFIEQAIHSDHDSKRKERLFVLPFVCALQSSFSREICEKLLKSGMINDFIDCFYESNNADEFHGVIKKYLEKEGLPVTITVNKKQLKTRSFLEYCKRWKITVSQIIFQKVSQVKSDVSFVKTNEFEMPAVEKVTFCKIALNEEHTFVHYFGWIMGLNVKIVRFDDCKLPEFTESFKQDLKGILSASKTKVSIIKHESEGSIEREYIMNRKEIKLDKSTFKPKQMEQESRPIDNKQVKENITSDLKEERQSENKNQTPPEKPPRTTPTEQNLGKDQSYTEADEKAMGGTPSDEGSKKVQRDADVTTEKQTTQTNGNLKSKSDKDDFQDGHKTGDGTEELANNSENIEQDTTGSKMSAS